MKNSYNLLKTAMCFALLSSVASADLAINFTAPNGRGDGDAASPVVADFLAYSAAQLDSGTFLFDADPEDAAIGGGNGGAWNYFNTQRTDVAGSGINVITSGGANGFNAGDVAWTDLDPILEGYTFGAAGQSLTFSGLASQTSAGDTIIVSAWGIGDNVGQQSSFNATYAGSTSADGQALYNGGGARSDSTGAVPAVHFSFLADGTTDTLDLAVLTSGHVNGVSLAFVSSVPEPSSFAVIGLASLVGLIRRRR